MLQARRLAIVQLQDRLETSDAEETRAPSHNEPVSKKSSSSKSVTDSGTAKVLGNLLRKIESDGDPRNDVFEPVLSRNPEETLPKETMNIAPPPGTWPQNLTHHANMVFRESMRPHHRNNTKRARHSRGRSRKK